MTASNDVFHLVRTRRGAECVRDLVAAILSGSSGGAFSGPDPTSRASPRSTDPQWARRYTRCWPRASCLGCLSRTRPDASLPEAMSAIDPTPYLPYWRQRAAREMQARAAAVARARSAVPVAVAVLRSHGARRVWLIGSLHRGTFVESSDLDFMTEGLDELAARAAAREARAAAGFPVDVLRREQLDEDWRAHHERFGELFDD
jgi:predicted nucleotidyltransferase